MKFTEPFIVTVKFTSYVKINRPMRPRDELIYPGDLVSSCNMVKYIWTVEGNRYKSICDNQGWITVSVKVKLMLTLIVHGTHGWNDSPRGPWRIIVILLVIFGLLKGRHCDSESETDIKINSPMRPGGFS